MANSYEACGIIKQIMDMEIKPLGYWFVKPARPHGAERSRDSDLPGPLTGMQMKHYRNSVGIRLYMPPACAILALVLGCAHPGYAAGKTRDCLINGDLWPHPFLIRLPLPAPKVTNLIERASAEEAYLVTQQACCMHVEAIAEEMILFFMRQADGPWDRAISNQVRKASTDVARLRADLGKVACPPRCLEMSRAADALLVEIEALYSHASKGDNRRARKSLEKAQANFRRLAIVRSSLCVTPAPDPTLVARILVENRQALLALATNATPARASATVKSSAHGRKKGAGADSMEQGTLSRINEANRKSPVLGYLAAILEGAQYTPFHANAFLVWRTEMQAEWFGMSNWAKIPNAAYNRIRFQAVDTITTHLRLYPDDLWAQVQKDILLDVENIQRGGEYGNDNLLYWGMYGLHNESDTATDKGR